MIALEASTLNSLFGIHPYVHHTHSCLRLVFDTNTRSRVRVKKLAHHTQVTTQRTAFPPYLSSFFPALFYTSHSIPCGVLLEYCSGGSLRQHMSSPAFVRTPWLLRLR